VRLIPKKYFKWREPKPFLAILDEHERATRRWWHPVLALLIVTSLTMIHWGVARLNPAKHPPSWAAALLLSLSLGAIVGYLLPRLETKLRSEIAVFHRCILRSRLSNQAIQFDRLRSFSWRTSEQFSTLILETREGRRIYIGVPPEVSVADLTSFLQERLLAMRAEA
jgi:hypothetical protein